jgi:hypothetical protein
MTRSRDPDIFVQLGATRDGLDPYLREARQRAMTAVLVETPAYLELRRQLGRAPFDVELGVDDPADPAAVRQALGDRADRVRLVLGGFERYNLTAHMVAHALGVPLARDARHRVFLPGDKASQRALLAELAPQVAQPGHVAIALDRMIAQPRDLAMLIELRRLRYPLVIKPSDGGGGLGVFLIDEPAQLDAAIAQLSTMTNYGGGAFARVVAEEFVEGTELSLQAVAFAGTAVLLTACEKLIVRERPRGGGPVGFREAAHIAQPGSAAPPAVHALAQHCVDAMGYSDGPFHIDAIQNSRGMYFVEMGFRLSGSGIVGLVERTAGVRWAELVFAIHLDHRLPAPVTAVRGDRSVGLATLASEAEVAWFRELAAAGEAAELHPITASALPEGDAQLASDRLRHGGFKARGFLTASDPAVIRQRFKHGLGARLELGACVD